MILHQRNMPELPEVETLVRGLRKKITGRTIQSVRLGKTDFMDNPAEIERELPGTMIGAVTRHGKFFSLSLENGSSQARRLFVHLGMTGHLGSFAAAEPEARHTHLVATLSDGRELRYTDPRRFGRIALFSEEQFLSSLAKAGAEPLEISREAFRGLLAGRNTRIKALLLDQHALGGIGNIYADESLWRARIHPASKAGGLDPARGEKLRQAFQRILAEAIALGGSSISDYRDAEGSPGEFQQRHRAYGRVGRPCFRCRARIRRIIVAGRSSFFCPRCQRAPRSSR